MTFPLVAAVASALILQVQVAVPAERGGLTLAEAVSRAAPGDTVRVGAGTHRGGIVVAVPMTLLGEAGAVIDGGGSGVILRVEAPDVEIAGLTVAGSGRSLAAEDAGIMAVNAPRLHIHDNVFRDVLFGIYLKESRSARIIGNQIQGKDLEIARRGDGIRLWYSNGGQVHRNRLVRSRDLVIWFSDSVRVEDNEVTDSRYGLHYMYSDHTHFGGNRFVRNRVGAFLMYSKDIVLENNVFQESVGASGTGLGLKDTDDVRGEGNLLIGNATGLYLDNSPTSVSARNRFEGNRLLGNDIGVSLLPSVRGNRFTRNEFSDNARPVVVEGGGSAAANEWRGNLWDDYVGFDRDGDGFGDTPHQVLRLSDHLMSVYPELRAFAFSPAAVVLDFLTRVLPFLAPKPVLSDAEPRISRSAT